jgi:pimeloyl-ACP methyl ester carboxylesterase
LRTNLPRTGIRLRILLPWAPRLSSRRSALVNRFVAKKAERNNPPTGKFVKVGGVRLHYIERGEGEALVLLHGNGSMIEDFSSSGLVDKAARRYRVIVFDRPGFGHSERPRRIIWTPENQADLICKALRQIGVSRAIVLGHSWGAAVAAALALKHPEMILASGYYYPTVRGDVVFLSGPAVPVIGDILSHTLSPILGRMSWPFLMRKIFGPSPVPKKFGGFPKEMALRPSQVRASAAESALMIPAAFAFRKHYARLKMPVTIIAGEEDRLIDIDKQSARLHHAVTQSMLRRVPGVGHMVHQTATDFVMAAIDETANQPRTACSSSPGPRIHLSVTQSVCSISELSRALQGARNGQSKGQHCPNWLVPEIEYST